VVSDCPSGDKRKIRFVGAGVDAATLFVACIGVTTGDRLPAEAPRIGIDASAKRSRTLAPRSRRFDRINCRGAGRALGRRHRHSSRRRTGRSVRTHSCRRRHTGCLQRSPRRRGRPVRTRTPRQRTASRSRRTPRQWARPSPRNRPSPRGWSRSRRGK
jgi:hypothetical protein